MIVLQTNRIAKSFSGIDILRNISLTVQEKERLAIVGANGAGKTTLLRILAGEITPDSGSVAIANGASVGYVSQYAGKAEASESVYSFVEKAFSEIRQMEQKLRQMEAQMADPALQENLHSYNMLMERYANLQKSFADAGGFSIDAQIRRILHGMNFPPETHTLSVSSLSGGQKTRLALARLLAAQPSLLLLDEPSNYLDTTTLHFLETYLQQYEGSVIVVSHDRYFLDEVATAIFHIEHGTGKRYPGNYNYFVETRALELEQQKNAYEAALSERQRLESFVQKNIARASTTKRAQSRRKLLERMGVLQPPDSQSPKLALQFSERRPSGKDVLEVHDLQIGHNQTPLTAPIHFSIRRGQRVALLGENGVGKTTLLRTLAGELLPLAGQIQYGTHVDLGYYSQEQENLNPQQTVLAAVWDEFPHLDQTTVRTALGRFLFRGEEVEKLVAGLSGGEKSRINLCRLMLLQGNTLLLDEPTNHLDLLAKEALEEAMEDFTGTILFVSHDRYFIDAMATHVGVLTKDGLVLHEGNYTDWLAREKAIQEAAEERARENQQIAFNERQKNAEKNSLKEIPKTRVRSADLRRARERVEKLENLIAEAETQLESCLQQQTTVTLEQQWTELEHWQRQENEIRTHLAELMKDWEHAQIHLEELERLNHNW